MNVFPNVRSLAGSRALRTPLFALMFLLPALLPAQTVAYVSNGLVSVVGVAPIYNGRYVLQQSDFGFFWLDTVTLAPGHVEAEAKCGGFQPPSDSDIYVIGDCNGISNVSSSGNFVLVRQLTGQCGAATRGCNGPRDDDHWRFTFALGSWDYLGDLGEIPDSTQTTDPQGRTWTIQAVDTGGQNFIWQASGIPNTPPIAGAFATNLSAGNRGDKTNYYGDKWQLRDVSSGGPTSVTWDFNYTGSFTADETGTEAAEGTVVGYFPCDPNGPVRGDIRSGTSCLLSLGLSNPPAAGSYQFAMRSANQFGPSANTFVSAALPVACPQANVAGYTGFTGTCAKTGGALSVPLGGNADASASTGNLAEASFGWTFSSPSFLPTSLPGQVVTVPEGTTGFALTITYPGGYQARASGAVTLTPPIVAAFSTPSPVVRGSTITLINQMQKPVTTTLNSVDYLIVPGACGSPPAVAPNPLASSFLTTGGAAPVTAPSVTGGYCIYLKYNYTPQGSSPGSQIVSRPLTVTDWTPVPAIGVYLDSGKTQSVTFMGGFFYLTAGTYYYLFDEESPPPAGTPYPGAQWSLISPSGTVALGNTATQAFLRVNFPTLCSSGCSLRLTVGGAAQQIGVNISACVPNATTLCLNDAGRFSVDVTWTTADGRSGAGQAVALTSDTGYFWFFSLSNVEMIVKVVDGRVVNSTFWVFAGGLTDVDVVMTVTDTRTGIVKIYHNPQGVPFQPIQDTSTFVASTASEPAEASSAGVAAAPAFVEEAADVASAVERLASSSGLFALQAPSAEAAVCTANATSLCLNKSRFKVQTQWTTADGRTGAGQAVALSGDTGYFWFFSSNNVETIVKVVDGCTFNSSFWVFEGGLTDVNVVTTVTDTQTGAVKSYVNQQGVPFQPIQDTSAFPNCP